MAESKTLNVTLSTARMDFVRRKIDSGEFPDESALIEAGVAVIRDDDAELEDWLHNVGGPIYDRMQADPSRGIPAEEVLPRIEERRLMSKQPA